MLLSRIIRGFGKHKQPTVPVTGIKPDYTDPSPMPRGVGCHINATNLNPGFPQKGKKINIGKGTTGPIRQVLGYRPGDKGHNPNLNEWTPPKDWSKPKYRRRKHTIFEGEEYREDR